MSEDQEDRAEEGPKDDVEGRDAPAEDKGTPRSASETEEYDLVLEEEDVAPKAAPVEPVPPPPLETPAPAESKGDSSTDIDGGKGLLLGLKDFSFKTLITPRIIGILYGIAIVFAALQALRVILLCLQGTYGLLGGIVGIVAAPVGFALAVVFTRVILEVIAVLFRIAERTDKEREEEDE